jgi:NAD(P)-dependent dehydrogenase (short-subunit alcohol dehydrogenase family)
MKVTPMPMPKFDFPKTEPGKRPVMLLTGASRGIGHATVMQFAMAGWRILSCSRQAFSEKCPWPSGADDHVQIDLADPVDAERGIAEIRRRLEKEGGKLNALVNNAGISPKGPGGKRLGAADTSFNDWSRVFQVNFFAPIMLARGLFAELKAAGGAIVNVTSIAGTKVHPFAGAAYATSKAALASLTREMASDFGPHGIRVNAISPGEIDTSILSPGTDRIVQTLPMRRLGTTEEVAKAIYFLCTDASSYVTGAELHINGGQHV